MRCPACAQPLTAVTIHAVTLDVCQQGCGGAWFDTAELNKVNAATPAGQSVLAKIKPQPNLEPDASRKRHCVRCAGIKLERKLFSLGTGVIMDCCPKCQGVWLDHGELETIREETHPAPRPPRHVIKRAAKSKSIPISFQVVQQVQHLRVQK